MYHRKNILEQIGLVEKEFESLSMENETCWYMSLEELS